MSLQEISALVMAAVGVIFMLIGGIGLLRLPNVLARMHGAGNASTVGVACLLLSAGIHFWDQNLFLRMVMLIALIFATGPISTAAMARAAYRTGSTRRLHLRCDELGEALQGQPLAGSAPEPASPTNESFRQTN